MVKRPSRYEQAAFHEAGHAVVAVLGRLRLKAVVLRPRRGDPRRWEANTRLAVPYSRCRAGPLLRYMLAGCEAERMTTRARNNTVPRTALEILESEHRRWVGGSLAILEKAHQHTRALVREHRPAIAAVARALLGRRRLTARQVRAIIRSAA